MYHHRIARARAFNDGIYIGFSFSPGERESIGLNQSDPREETCKGLKVGEAAIYAKEAEQGGAERGARV